MPLTEPDILHYLEHHQLPYQYVAHPPVYTCEQAELYRPALPGVSTKNLFLRDEKRRFYLVMTACEKRLDLKQLGKVLGTTKLHFGDEASLVALLGVTPGAVTVLGLINDTGQQIELVVDSAVWDGAYFLCHPLVNTATLVLAQADLRRFFALTGHTPRLVDIPARTS
jgi:Ala-tRNA(Pro) deacylase